MELASTQIARRPNRPRTPAVVQSLRFLLRPFGYLQECQQRYGDTFKIRMLVGRKIMLFSDPNSVREIFQASDDTLQAGRAVAPLMPLLAQRTFLKMDGPEHRRRKKLLARAFTKECVSKYAALARVVADRATTNLADGNTISAEPLVQDLVFDIVTTMIFGPDRSMRFQSLKTDFLRVWNSFSIFHLALPILRTWLKGPSGWHRVEHVRDRMNCLIEQEVARAMEAETPRSEGILGSLTSQQDEASGWDKDALWTDQRGQDSLMNDSRQ